MKKIITFILLFAAFALQDACAQYKEGYYDAMDGKKREQLKAAAKKCVVSHRRLDYYSLPNYWQYSDVYPELVDGCRRWWDMYSNAKYLIKDGMTGKESFSANRMQREHAVPKSWWKKNGNVEYTPAYSDMWNLYPSDGAANQAKLNYPFGVTRSTTFDNGVSRIGPAASGYGGGSANVFEPADEYKGDFARAIFYMATVYDDINWVYHYMFNAADYPTLTGWAVNMLLQWSRRDPVSQKEIDRNNAVEQYQLNRNPFVDFPELAEYIWGQRQTEVFYLADQEGTEPTPPITGDPEITSPRNGEALDFGEAAEGHGISRALQITGHNLTSPLSVRVSGTDAACFIPEVTSIPASTMNRHGGYLLNIEYTPSSIGKHEALLILYDGGIAGSIAVTLHGEGAAVPELHTLNALDPVDVTPAGYTARWDGVPAGAVADYYVLTRVRYIDGNQEAETCETGETSYPVKGREDGVAESYSVQYSRLGMLSPASNTIYIAAGSGISDMVESVPFRAVTTEGGFMILCDGAEGETFDVLSVDGTPVMRDEPARDGTVYQLPQGVYILVSPRHHPQKIAVGF